MTNDSRKPAILVDIDGVLCDVPYNPEPEDFTWDKLMKADLQREPIKAGIQLVKCLVDQGLYPVFITARPDFMRFQTEKFLNDCGFYGLCYMATVEASKLMTGPNYRYHQKMEKDRIIREHNLTEEFDFLYAIDDHEENARMYKEWWNIPTLQARF